MLIALRPLSRRLLLLVVAALLPVVLIGSAALYRLNAERRSTLEETMIQSARAIANAMDGELQRSVSVASALGAASSLDQADSGAFYRVARRVLDNEPAWITISLADASGRYLFNLQRPYGAPLPARLIDAASLEALSRTRKPAISGLFVGRVSAEALFTVRVPVVREATLRYIISAALRPKAMLEMVGRQQIPPEGIVAISDQNGAIVARSRRHDEYLGKPITPDLREAIAQQGEGFASLMTLDGQKTYAAFSRSRYSGWAVAIGMPSEAIDGPVRRSYLALGAGGLLSLALGSLGALLLGRRITRPIRDMSGAAAAIGRGEQPHIPDSRIPELQAMAAAMGSAAQARREAERVREQALAFERSARAEAEDTNRRKDEFLAMLGHELRNPLGVLSNATQLLLRRPAPDEDSRETHRILARQTTHLARLIDDLLEASRVMAGKIQLERAPLELGAEVARVAQVHRNANRLQGHDVSVDTEPVWIEADGHRLEQVISNLLDNAIKYTPAGGRIEVSVLRAGGDALLEVRDEGIGIEPGMADEIFDLFVQGRRTLERSQGGLGIGLTLVRRLVELHGGRIEAHSAGPGRGSRFTVRLPALAALPQRAAVASSAAQKVAPRTILIVEDGDDARRTLRRLLELEGHRVLEAHDGPQGLRCALEHRPDVALVDIGLPGFDGYECARRIRADAAGRAITLVALTGYGLPADRSRALDAGFDLHVAKPVSSETLSALLAKR